MVGVTGSSPVTSIKKFSHSSQGSEENTSSPWRPTFVDYLFLAFTTATALSPTDTLPLMVRAKLMMAESAIALVTVAAVASRAINILGS